MKRRKRNIIYVSDDDDDDDDEKKKNKKPHRCRSHSLSSSAQLLNNFDESKFLSGALSLDFSTINLSTPTLTLSWVDKYTPLQPDHLAVHKKKVDQVKFWFQQMLTPSKKDPQNYVLIITGQAGIGKSATVRVLASHFQAELCEWTTPVPTIWQEHVHNFNTGMHYISKLDEFENFVDRVRKYGMLSSSFTGSRQSVLLIEDLPVANGRIAQRRLLNCLQTLVKSVQVPTVILITEYSAADYADTGMRLWEEILSSLESSGACKIAFNPITVNSIKKVLSKICKQEKCDTSFDRVDLIANASGGDIRHAITTLQYICLKQEKKVLVSSENFTSDLEAEIHDHGPKDAGYSLAVGRDQTLSLFHALGKFLHNKRDTECISHSQDGLYLKEGFTRLPLKMDAPERVLCQAYGQARPVAEFLHENALDFLSEEAIEDAWILTSYLSDVDFLLSSVHRTLVRNYEADNVIQSAAASVAVRGVLFGNAHPSPSRWHSIRRPQLWQVEKSTRCNMHEIERQRIEHCYSLDLCNISVICTDYRPTLKWLGYRASSSALTLDQLENDELDMMISQEQARDNISDDDIEEW